MINPFNEHRNGALICWMNKLDKSCSITSELTLGTENNQNGSATCNRK